MKYLVRLTSEVEVEAENVMQAAQLAKNIRVFGERSGVRRLANNRDFSRYVVRVVETTKSIPKKVLDT